ncbi:MAG TPA: hypothetical protein PLE55_00100 [Clostridiales bacterium]|nr:hypothetical protein [Clostridiales bacterium]
MEKVKSVFWKIADNRIFCMVWLFLGAGFITWFGALKVTYLGVTYPRFVKTASVIAMCHPKLYYLWIIFMIAALWLNITYMYRHNGYRGKAGRVTMYLGFACIIMTKIIPHEDEFNWRMVVHWTSVLAFGVFCAASIVLFLANKSKENRRYFYTLLSFIFVLAAMIVLLILFKENGAIETLPIWSAYVILYLANFTGLYKSKAAVQKAPAGKET